METSATDRTSSSRRGEIAINDAVISTVVYASACAQGTWFRYNTRGVIPEELPEEWESECQPGVDDDIANDVEDDALLQVDFEHEGADDVDDGLLQDEELAALSADEQQYITPMERCRAWRLLFGTGPT